MPEDLNENEEYTPELPQPKKEKFKLPLMWVVIIVLLTAVLTFQITYVAQANRYRAVLNSAENTDTDYELLDELEKIYEKYYVGDIDDIELKNGILSGYVYGTGDKYGNFMSAEQYAEYTDKMSNNLVGIGISAIEADEPAGIEIVKVFSDTPASEAGLVFGDIITAVDGKTVAEVSYGIAIDMVAGEEGSTVTLTVYDPATAQTRTVDVVRRAVNIETVEYRVVQDDIGYVRITNFYEKTPTEFKSAVNALIEQNVKGLVFDVRGNPGGRLDAIVSVLDYLLPEGVIIRMADSSGKFTTHSSDSDFIDLPMTVLVNGSTASAAELFTSALMDYDKATVIGTQTYGKGTVTSPFKLSDGSWVYISTQLYYPPISDNFEGVGIKPDIVLELSEDAQHTNLYKLTYENDAQLQKAVEILKK